MARSNSKNGRRKKSSLKSRAAAVRKAEKRQRLKLAMGEIADLAPDDISELLAQSEEPQVYVDRLRAMAVQQYKTSRTRVRKKVREALQLAYAAVLAVEQLDREVRQDVLVELADRGGSRTNAGDHVRIILKAMMDYAGRKADRSVVTRDSNAIKYALGQKIPVVKFVDRLGRKGESIRAWSNRFAEKSSRRRPSEPRDRRIKETGQQRANPAPANNVIELPTLKLRGYHLCVLRYGKSGAVSVGELRFLGKSLTPDLIDQALTAAATAVPQREVGDE